MHAEDWMYIVQYLGANAHIHTLCTYLCLFLTHHPTHTHTHHIHITTHYYWPAADSHVLSPLPPLLPSLHTPCIPALTYTPSLTCTHHPSHALIIPHMHSSSLTFTHHPSHALIIPHTHYAYSHCYTTSHKALLIESLTYVITTLHPAGPRDVSGADGGDLLQEVSPEELQSALEKVVSKTVSSFKNEISQKLKTSEQGHLNRLALVEKTVASWLLSTACIVMQHDLLWIIWDL